LGRHVLALALCCALPALAHAQVRGWSLSGADPSAFRMERDTLVTHGRSVSVRLESIAKPKGFASMAQCIDAAAYRGKRVRFSAYARTKDVQKWSGLWLRVDDAAKKAMAFDNMERRALSGTADWQRCEIVLDVPREAATICLGVLLVTEGAVWVSEMEFVPVPRTVPVTDMTKESAPRAPRNLGFDR
jgi:hypothetical protein